MSKKKLPVINSSDSKNSSQFNIPNDGTFIHSDDKHDGFASINTVRYGEEVDVDDLQVPPKLKKINTL